jgi:Uma2 family endonuclease
MTKREQVDGATFVQPAPVPFHQAAVLNLLWALYKPRPRSLAVLSGPLEFKPTTTRTFVPDVLMMRRASVPWFEPTITEPPLLIAEVVDDASRAWDKWVKPKLYAESGVEHYWLFDPHVPEFVAYRLAGDEYKEVVTARGDERVGFDAPVLVEICPARLRDEARRRDEARLRA